MRHVRATRTVAAQANQHPHENRPYFSHSVDAQHFASNACQRICIAYEEHSYVICLSNKKVYVVKKKHPASSGHPGNLGGPTVDPVEPINVLA